MESPRTPNYDDSLTRKRLGLCLPCYGTPQETQQQEDVNRVLNEQANPFPLLGDLRSAYTLTPIKAHWFPGKMVVDDWYTFASHETIHYYLLNTPLSYYTFILVHFQYAALIHRLLVENEQISIPSLKEPSGILASAQAAIDAIDRPMALIHELMATTVVRAFAEQGLVLQASSFWRETMIGSDPKLRKTIRPDDPTWAGEDFISKMGIVPSRPGWLERVVEVERKSWIPHYSAVFSDYDFRTLYRRLLDCWRTMARGFEGDTKAWCDQVMWLSQHPFQVPLSFPNRGSLIDVAHGIAAYVKTLAERPLQALETLLAVIEAAEGIRGPGKWIRWFRQELPGFDRYANESELRLVESVPSGWVRAIWDHYTRRHEIYTGWGAWFAALYAKPYEGSAVIYRLPGLRDRTYFNSYVCLTLTLEAMRQSLLTGQGPVCLCGRETTGTCFGERTLLCRLWELTVPDPDYDVASFQQRWRKPQCPLPEA